jgi:hypothetical protein
MIASFITPKICKKKRPDSGGQNFSLSFFLANFCSISTSRNEKEHYCIANSLFFQKTIAKVLGENFFGEKFVTFCHSF